MNILFVCTENTSRGPIAEAIFNKLSEGYEFNSNSVGISIVQGSTITENTVNLLKRELSVNLEGKQSVQVSECELKNSNLVLTMTKYTKEFLIKNFPSYENKIYSIGEYAGILGDIKDPYGSSIDVYEKIYKDLERLISIILDKIKKEESI